MASRTRSRGANNNATVPGRRRKVVPEVATDTEGIQNSGQQSPGGSQTKRPKRTTKEASKLLDPCFKIVYNREVKKGKLKPLTQTEKKEITNNVKRNQFRKGHSVI